MDVNKWMGTGRLVENPELFTKGDLTVVNFRMAINEKDTIFVDFKMFGPRAASFAQFMKKGRFIFVEGKLRTDEWKDKEGMVRRKMFILVDNFEFMDGKTNDKDKAA